MNKAAIVGVGLMGGSLGIALSRQKKWRVVGVGREMSRLRRAKTIGLVHEATTDLAAGMDGASVVFLAVPVDQIVSMAKKIRPLLPAGALVMDIGSVKSAIVRPLEKVLYRPRRAVFCGRASHDRIRKNRR
jgi:prephenate dehydrogenase